MDLRRSLVGVVVAAVVTAAMTLAGCRSNSTSANSTSAEPAEIGPAECAACGMVVREQPAPRAQLIHRDGHRAYFCSIGDLLHYLEGPSPHGQVVEIYVETVDPKLDPADTSPAARPWIDAASATYVVGIDRPGIMGPPALVFESAAAAQAVATKRGGQVVGWPRLGDALFSTGIEAAHPQH
jgi:copper chaperone NosL